MMKFGIVSEAKPGFVKVYFESDDLVTDWWPVVRQTSLKDFESWPLNVQEHVVCVCDERCIEGVVMGAIHSKADPPDEGAGDGKFRKVFEDGTYLEYDKSAHKLTAYVNGELLAQTTGDAKVTAGQKLEAMGGVKVSVSAPSVEVIAGSSISMQASSVTIMGNVAVTGMLSATGAISAASIATTGGGSISAGSGSISTSGEISATDVKAGGISLLSHKHPGVTTGGGSTGTPIP